MTENIELIARKSNDLIQNFECPFTAQQQKICMYLVAQLKPWDEGFQPLEVSVKDFCLACGIDEPGGRSYKHLEKAIQDFGFKWIKRQNGKKEALIWFKYVKIENGKITFLFNEMMTPYILYLQNNFTKIEFDYTAKMKSKYSIRLYELLYSYYYNKFETYEFILSLNELKQKLDANYKLYTDVMKRALLPAVEEINRLTDVFVEYQPIKEGKKVAKISFTIILKSTIERIKLAGILDEYGKPGQFS